MSEHVITIYLDEEQEAVLRREVDANNERKRRIGLEENWTGEKELRIEMLGYIEGLKRKQEEEDKLKTVNEILESLNKLPEEFRRHFMAGEYCKAASDHEEAVRVSAFIEIGPEARTRLLMRFDPEEPIEGLIEEEWRIKAEWWCIMHGYAHSRHTYQNVMRLG